MGVQRKKDPQKTILVTKTKRNKLQLDDLDIALTSLKDPTAVEKDIQKAVQNQYKEAKQKVDHYYPIYSDKKGAWQADIMFEPYTVKNITRVHGFFVMVNINTKYAFVKQQPFTPSSKDEEWIPVGEGKKLNIKQKGGATSSVKARNALQDILKKDIPREQQYLHQQTRQRLDFPVEVIYTDEGSEFKGDFEKFCQKQGIRHVTFTPSTGTKRRLGIVERFIRTLRRYMETYKKEKLTAQQQDNFWFPTYVQQVVDRYNRHKNHSSIRQFVRKGLGGRFRIPKQITLSPAFMMRKGREDIWMKYKMGYTAAVDKYYKKTIDHLKKGAYVRYFNYLQQSKRNPKKDHGAQFSKLGKGTLMEYYKTTQSHQYCIVGRSTRNRTYQTGQQGKSFELRDSLFRVLP